MIKKTFWNIPLISYKTEYETRPLTSLVEMGRLARLNNKTTFQIYWKDNKLHTIHLHFVNNKDYYFYNSKNEILFKGTNWNDLTNEIYKQDFYVFNDLDTEYNQKDKNNELLELEKIFEKSNNSKEKSSFDEKNLEELLENFSNLFEKIVLTIHKNNVKEKIEELKQMHKKFINSYEIEELKKSKDLLGDFQEFNKEFLKIKFKDEIAKRYIFAYDLDDTLIHSKNTINLIDADNKIIKKYWTLEFELLNSKGEYKNILTKLDFEEFKDSDLKICLSINNKKSCFKINDFFKSYEENYLINWEFFSDKISDCSYEWNYKNEKIYLKKINGEILETYDLDLFLKEFNTNFFKQKIRSLDFDDFWNFEKSFIWILNGDINKDLLDLIKLIKSIWGKNIIITARSNENAVKSALQKLELLNYFSQIYCINSYEEKYKNFLKGDYKSNSSVKKFRILKHYMDSKKDVLKKIIYFDDSDKHGETVLEKDEKSKVIFVKV